MDYNERKKRKEEDKKLHEAVFSYRSTFEKLDDIIRILDPDPPQKPGPLQFGLKNLRDIHTGPYWDKTDELNHGENS